MALESELVQVAIAILYQDNKFLMQLRDDIPSILYAGHWGFFGGHLEPGESPETGVLRELREEINYSPDTIHKFCFYPPNGKVLRCVFHAPLTVALDQLDLQEGQDLGLVSIEEIQQGYAYSHRLQQFRPLGAPHQQILLEFIASRT